jgi:hypothetical protein
MLGKDKARELAVETYLDLKKENITPTTGTYLSFANIFCHAQKSADILEMILQMKKDGVKLNEHTHEAWSVICGKMNLYTKVRHVLDEMRRTQKDEIIPTIPRSSISKLILCRKLKESSPDVLNIL